MSLIAPEGAVYQAGTLSGNPLAMAAGIATLRLLKEDATLYERLEAQAKTLCAEAEKAAEKFGVPLRINRLGSLFTLFFTEQEAVESYADVMRADTEQYKQFHAALLERGVYFAPSQFEVAFVSAAHGEGEIRETATAVAEALETFN